MAEDGERHAADMAGNEPAANGGPAVAVDAANGAAENGEVLHPAPAAAAAHGRNAAMGNAGAMVLDLSLMQEPELHQLFIRMPAAMVARCRAVCRLWRDVTDTEDFRRDHHVHRSLHPMPMFFYRHDPLEDPFCMRGPPMGHVHVHLRAVDIRYRESVPVFHFAHFDPALRSFDPRVFRIEGSCDGILLLSFDAWLYACNPWARRWRRLPPLHRRGDIVGFYARDMGDGTREYRVLYHMGQGGGDGKGDGEDCRYWILTMAEHQVVTYRCIGRPADLEDIRLVLAGGICPSYEMPPVMVQGRLHWLPQRYQDNSNLLMFDTVAEQFSWVHPPIFLSAVADDWEPMEGDRLLAINGRLAMIDVSPTVVDVLTLRDYAGQMWAIEYRIGIPLADIEPYGCYERLDGQDFLSAVAFPVSEDRNVLLQGVDALLQCGVTDTRAALLQTHRISSDYCTILSGHMLQESFLLHDFLPLGPDDANNGDPPFFQEPFTLMIPVAFSS